MKNYFVRVLGLVFLLGVSAVLISGAGCRSNRTDPEIPAWTNYRINTSVFSMAFQGDLIWVGTDRGILLYHLKEDRVVSKFDSSNGLVSDVITVIKIGPTGGVWVGTYGGGMSKYDGSDWTHYNTPDLSDPYVYDILFDPEGRMWVANWKGVSVFDGKNWKSYTEEDGIIDDWVYALARDRDGVMWLGTEGGVSRYDGAGFINYTHQKDGLGADLKSIGEFEKIENPSFHHKTSPGKEAEGYNPNYILSAAVDSENNKWFGTWGAGLTRFDGKEWVNFSTVDGLAGNFVADIFVDKKGVLFAATDGGVSMFKKGRWTTLSELNGLVNNGVFSVVPDLGGKLWFGTLEGISKLEGFKAP